jgi:hypothetical protein
MLKFLYIIDLIAFWAAYNFLHIVKLKYINNIIGISSKNEYFNRLETDYSNENSENLTNLVFYFTILIICLFVYNNINK